MKNFVKRMVDEHAQLVGRISALHNYVYSERSDADNKVEFANKCIQLASMKKYEEALRARLENQNVFFENGQYFERFASIAPSKEEIEEDINDEERPSGTPSEKGSNNG